MSIYDEKIWLKTYQEGQPAEIVIQYENALEMFKHTVQAYPENDAIRYFDGRITFRELDTLTDCFAAGLVRYNVTKGDRVALYLQNIPQFIIAQIATWKVGGIAVSVNPMNKERELKEILQDSGAVVLVTLETLYIDVAKKVIPSTDVQLTITTSELDYQTRNDLRLMEKVKRQSVEDAVDFIKFIKQNSDSLPERVALQADDIAFLTYTSGTTGPPKGAMTTHRNVVFNAQTYRDWISLTENDIILGIAPLFHITGLIGHIAVSLLIGAPLLLMYRFDPEVTVETIETEKATFTVGSITGFISLMNVQSARKEALASLNKIYSGGAPIPPSTVTAFEEAFGQYIHNIYGLTETTSPSHAVPYGRRAPVDEKSGALSVGVPVYNTIVRIIGEDGNDLPIGEVGELVTAGPQVVAGYWNKPDETAHALPGGVLHTGDVGYMDGDGWFYIIDRKKDQINVSGYKVWPREVEDVLYGHEAVREVAVVGVPDEYRGETVKAFVSLRPGMEVLPTELVDYARQRLAAYKYPREVVILGEIPKTISGKVLRRVLREYDQK